MRETWPTPSNRGGRQPRPRFAAARAEIPWLRGMRAMRAMRAMMGTASLAIALLCGGCMGEDVSADPTAPSPGTEHSEPGDDGDGATPAAAGEATPAAAAGSATSAAAPVPDPVPSDAGQCVKKADRSVGVMLTPRRATAGKPVQIVAATLAFEEPLAVRIETGSGDGVKIVEAAPEFWPGVPSATIVRLDAAPAGEFRVVVGRGGTGLRCVRLKSSKHGGSGRVNASSADGVWPVRRAWNGGEEALFSAWVRALFHAARGEDVAYKALHEATSQPDRNLLFNSLGFGEDDRDTRRGLFLRPDCADTPYFLRAYFAWKRGLPFGFRQCSRGAGGKAPHCGKLRGVIGAPEHGSDSKKAGELGVVQKFFRRTVAWGVHTGNGRTAFGDDDTDFYPLVLSRKTLRPGSIYADPYGHIFVLVELMAAHGDQPGVLYAIDGQPDGSITRKRFWEGNFLWNPDPTLGGSGFKAFRPLVTRREGDAKILAALTDKEIAGRPDYGDIGRDQAKLDPNGFYDTMDALITPGTRDPEVAQEEAIQALFEAAKVRVTSVQNGEDNHRDHPGKVIKMPDGYKIFETTGAWENFSTPARDLRMLIAIDVVQNFVDKVARQPQTFGVSPGPELEALRKRLAEVRDRRLRDEALQFRYTRSDGSSFTVGLHELVDRAEALQMAYNPNDCPEIRWGAKKASPERSTCRRHAPSEQRAKMEAYRPWFRDRRRPARGDPGPPVPSD